jgi:hypothetical protein
VREARESFAADPYEPLSAAAVDRALEAVRQQSLREAAWRSSAEQHAAGHGLPPDPHMQKETAYIDARLAALEAEVDAWRPGTTRAGLEARRREREAASKRAAAAFGGAAGPMPPPSSHPHHHSHHHHHHHHHRSGRAGEPDPVTGMYADGSFAGAGGGGRSGRGGQRHGGGGGGGGGGGERAGLGASGRRESDRRRGYDDDDDYERGGGRYYQSRDHHPRDHQRDPRDRRDHRDPRRRRDGGDDGDRNGSDDDAYARYAAYRSSQYHALNAADKERARR